MHDLKFRNLRKRERISSHTHTLPLWILDTDTVGWNDLQTKFIFRNIGWDDWQNIQESQKEREYHHTHAAFVRYPTLYSRVGRFIWNSGIFKRENIITHTRWLCGLHTGTRVERFVIKKSFIIYTLETEKTGKPIKYSNLLKNEVAVADYSNKSTRLYV